MDHHCTDFRKGLLFWSSTTRLVKTSVGKISKIMLTMSLERGWGILKDTVELRYGKCRMCFLHSLVRIRLPVLSVFDVFMSFVLQLCESATPNCWIYCIHWYNPASKHFITAHLLHHFPDPVLKEQTVVVFPLQCFPRAEQASVRHCVCQIKKCCIYPKRNFLVQL